MAQSGTSQHLLGLVRTFKRSRTFDPLTKYHIPQTQRSLATAVDIPTISSSQYIPLGEQHSPSGTILSTTTSTIPLPSQSSPPITNTSRVLATLYSWPHLEPQSYTFYPTQHLSLPLRKDILHRAVIHEGDVARGFSTASTKWRTAVHGSNRKIAPQKGMGRARVGDKKSPIRRGGGVAFGPHPRDFTTELPRKIYDLAWRTAVSHRYRLGELVVVGDLMRFPSLVNGAGVTEARDVSPRLLENMFLANKWDRSHGRSLLVTNRVDYDMIATKEEEELARAQEMLFEGMEQIGEHGTIKDLDDVSVKDLLIHGRVVIDRPTLDLLFERHESDLKSRVVQVC